MKIIKLKLDFLLRKNLCDEKHYCPFRYGPIWCRRLRRWPNCLLVDNRFYMRDCAYVLHGCPALRCRFWDASRLTAKRMTKREKIAALLRMTVDRGCTAAEAETARRLAAKLQAERAPTETIARRFDSPVTMDLHRSRRPPTTRGRH